MSYFVHDTNNPRDIFVKPQIMAITPTPHHPTLSPTWWCYDMWSLSTWLALCDTVIWRPRNYDIWYIYMDCNTPIHLIIKYYLPGTTCIFTVKCVLIQSWQVSVNLRTSALQIWRKLHQSGYFFQKRFVSLDRLFACGSMCLIAQTIGDAIWCLGHRLLG